MALACLLVELPGIELGFYPLNFGAFPQFRWGK